MKYHSYSPTLAQLHGKKPSKVDRLIQLRSEMTHTEIQFSDRYGGISFSATMADECKCARFKMIGYGHPERWLTTALRLTDEQEDAVFKKCCEMADFPEDAIDFKSEKVAKCQTPIFYGQDALKYDIAAVSISFVTKWNLWRGSKTKVFCTEACFIALMEAWPCMLEFHKDQGDRNFVARFTKDDYDNKVRKIPDTKLDPDQLTPSLGDAVIRDWARRQG